MKSLCLIISMSIIFVSCINTQVSTIRSDLNASDIEKVSDSIGSQLKLKKIKENDGATAYITPFNEFLSRSNFYPIYKLKITVEPDDGMSNIKIITLNESETINIRLNKCINSFFLQEVGKDDPRESYMELQPKSMKEMWKRNFINLGYGMHYSGMNSPFISDEGAWAAILFWGLWDIAHFIPIIGGPFFGKTEEDRIGIPVIGLTSLLCWKIVIPLDLNLRLIRGHNSFVNSKYKIPKMVR